MYSVCGTALHHTVPLNFECPSAPSTKAAMYVHIRIAVLFIVRESLHSRLSLNKIYPQHLRLPRAVLIVPVYVDSVAILVGSIDTKLKKFFNNADHEKVGVQ